MLSLLVVVEPAALLREDLVFVFETDATRADLVVDGIGVRVGRGVAVGAAGRAEGVEGARRRGLLIGAELRVEVSSFYSLVRAGEHGSNEAVRGSLILGEAQRRLLTGRLVGQGVTVGQILGLGLESAVFHHTFL